MSKEDVRLTITRQAELMGVPAWIPLCIARVESSYNPDCVGDNGTSFGLFQLHRGGLAPAEMSDEELKNPNANASIAIRGMVRAYQHGNALSMKGIELLKFVAFTSGWPCMLGVEWAQEHRPDYVNMLAKSYLEEMSITEQGDQPKEPEGPQPSLPTAGPEVYSETDHIYHVQPGDTLSAIGLHLCRPWDVLARYNGIENPNVITVGQLIKCPSEYRVKPGDTLSEICQTAWNGSGEDYWRWVAYVNDIDPDRLHVGQVLYI